MSVTSQRISVSMNDEGSEYSSRKWGLIGAAFGLPLFVLGIYLGHPDKGIVAAMSVAILVLVARGYWTKRDKVWVWVAFLIAILLHVGVISIVHFERLGRPAILVFMPIGFLDLLALVVLFRSAEKLADALSGERKSNIAGEP